MHPSQDLVNFASEGALPILLIPLLVLLFNLLIQTRNVIFKLPPQLQTDEPLQYFLLLANQVLYHIFVAQDVDTELEARAEFFEHQVADRIDAVEYILPHLEDQLVGLQIGRQHTNLLKVTAIPHLIYILLFYAIKRLQDVRAIEHYKLVVNALAEVVEILAQCLPAPLSESQALQLGMRPVGEANADHIREGVGGDGCPVAELELVLDLIIELVANIILALHDKVHFVDLLLLPVNNTAILKHPGLQQLQELDDEELVLVVLEGQVRVLGEAGPLVLFVEGACRKFELLPNLFLLMVFTLLVKVTLEVKQSIELEEELLVHEILDNQKLEVYRQRIEVKFIILVVRYVRIVVPVLKKLVQLVFKIVSQRQIIIKPLPQYRQENREPIQVVPLLQLLLHFESDLQHHVVHVREDEQAEEEEWYDDHPFKITVRPIVPQANC